MEKPASNIYPIHDLIRQRWSPRAFSSKPVEPGKLQNMFEAARWAASGFNDQPWRFVVGLNYDESWSRIFETLVPFNQLWARQAPVLVMICADTISRKNGLPGTSFEYDAGQAAATLCLQAVAEGLITHQMGGFEKEKARRSFSIPVTIRPLVVMAIGYHGEEEKLPENLLSLERAARVRSDFNTFVFSGQFGQSSNLF